MGVCISPTRVDPRPFVGVRILACLWCHVGLGWCVRIHPVAHTEGPVCGRLAVRPLVSFHSRTGAGVWAFIRSPTRSFFTTRGVMCGRLAIRPHTSFTHAEGAGVWTFITSPTPKAGSCHVFLQGTWQLPNFACKQMTTLFYPSCHVFLHGTWQLP